MTIDRSSLGMVMLAAWLNVRVDQIPLENRAHINPWTIDAWERVGRAAIEWQEAQAAIDERTLIIDWLRTDEDNAMSQTTKKVCDTIAGFIEQGAHLKVRTKQTVMNELMAEAKRQQPPRKLTAMDRILRAFKWFDGWFVLKGYLAARRPMRWIWIAACTYALHTRFNAPSHQGHRHTWLQSWQYATGLSEMLDEPGEGYLAPSEAIDEDRQYWDD